MTSFHRRRGSEDAELRRELEAHLAERVDDLRDRGLSDAEAWHQARLEFGNAERHLESSREVWHWRWLADARRDLQYAVRTLGRTPGFTALALLTLALGIGSVTVIYSVINNVLWDPLPYPDSDRFVNVRVQDAAGGARVVFSAAELIEFRDQSQVFEGVVGTRGDSMLLALDDRVEQVRVVHVTPNFFTFMGLPPAFGRAATMDDGRPGAPAVAVLRHRAWVTYFNGDPSVVGRTVMLGGEPRTIIGVMPARFTWHAADVWIPRAVEASGSAPFWNFQARLERERDDCTSRGPPSGGRKPGLRGRVLRRRRSDRPALGAEIAPASRPLMRPSPITKSSDSSGTSETKVHGIRPQPRSSDQA